jgi:hypothetical protein
MAQSEETVSDYVVNIFNADDVLLAFKAADTMKEAEAFAKHHVKSLHPGCYTQVRGAERNGKPGPLIFDSRDGLVKGVRDDD